MGDPLLPTDASEAVEAMHEIGARGATVRIRGGCTKLGWGNPVDVDVELSTERLDRLLEHNQGDFTVAVEPGMRLAELQRRLADAGQRLALDPPLGAGERATVGGVVATGDAGPLRQRYGTPRDLVLGVSVVLPGGLAGKAGGRVIKNVAGYDLAKLYARSFGSLGLISRLVLRVHPLARDPRTVIGSSADPEALAAAALSLASCPLEPERLDLRWAGGSGEVLIEVAGAASAELAERAAGLLAEAGLRPEPAGDGEAAWRRQREAQRSAGGAVILVSTERTRLTEAIAAARGADASVVGRAGHGVLWLSLAPAPDAELAERVRAVRRALEPARCALMDAPESVRGELDPFAISGLPEARLMAAVKARFDPDRRCCPGLLAEWI